MFFSIVNVKPNEKCEYQVEDRLVEHLNYNSIRILVSALNHLQWRILTMVTQIDDITSLLGKWYKFYLWIIPRGNFIGQKLTIPV